MTDPTLAPEAPVPHYADGPVTVYLGDCIAVMAGLPDASVDAVVTDPPYGISMMGRSWDNPGAMVGHSGRLDPTRPGGFHGRPGGHSRGYAENDSRLFQAWCEEWAREAFRVLRPGGHLLAFGGTRTFHRLTVGIEDAGFDVRDQIGYGHDAPGPLLAWMYGNGFPKSLDVSKAVDAHLGAERAKVRFDASVARNPKATGGGNDGMEGATRPWQDAARERGWFEKDGPVPATAEGAAWQGWGTALKPAWEPIVVARKPLAGTVAANVLAHGTGALNIDATRLPTTDRWAATGVRSGDSPVLGDGLNVSVSSTHEAGRWPANVVLDETAARELDTQSGDRPGMTPGVLRRGVTTGRGLGSADTFEGGAGTVADAVTGYGDRGGASRFFYTPKASTDERPSVDGVAHPTVKPVALMRFLVRLVTPKGGTVLEPFAGSGSTVEAAVLEGFSCIAIEKEPDYLPLILKRIRKPHAVGLFDVEPDPLPVPDPERPREAPPAPAPAPPVPATAGRIDETALDFGDWSA